MPKGKVPAGSPYTFYSIADISYFIRQVEFNPALYDRIEGKGHRTDERELIWMEIEDKCKFLKAATNKGGRGKNAQDLWLNLMSEMRKEDKRLDSLTAESSSSEENIQFIFYNDMEFVREIDERDRLTCVNIAGHSGVEDDDDATEQALNRTSTSGRSSKKRKADGSGYESCLERLVKLAERELSEANEKKEGSPISKYENDDLYSNLERLISSLPLSERFAFKSTIFLKAREMKNRILNTPEPPSANNGEIRRH